jgi:hypothetical protein
MAVIFILELVCDPHGHVLEAIAWDDETHTENDAAFRLGMLALPVLPVCAVCGSTSTRLRNLPTAHATTTAAAGSRLGCAVLKS